MDKKIYIAGKISGLPDLNKPKFEAATKKLRDLGFIVRNPHEICEGIDPESWEACMKRCLTVMLDCDLVLVLDDWELSRGAKLEVKNAAEVKIPVYPLEEWIQTWEEDPTTFKWINQ